MKLIIKILASGFGTGYSPLAPGTTGTLLAAILYWYVIPHNFLIFFLVSIILLILSVPISSEAEKIFSKKDDPRIVIDEVVGFWVSVLFLPYSVAVVVFAFVLFRLFDVRKPFFIKRTQNLPKGFGIVADDLFAGLLTNAVLQVGLIIYRAI